MTIGPAGTAAPSPGSVIVTVSAGPTVKARDAGRIMDALLGGFDDWLRLADELRSE